MASKILQIDLQDGITPQIGSYDNAGGVTPNNWRNEGGVYSLGPTNRDGRTPYYWFTPTREVTDFDLCWEDYQDHEQTTPQYHLEIGDSAGNVVLSAFQQHANYYIGPICIRPPAYQTWHKILIEVRKASASSSTVTAYVDGKKVATGTSNTLLTSAKIALLGHVPNIFYMQNAGQRLRYVTIYDRSYTSKGINLDGMMTTITALIPKLIAKFSTVAFTGSYNDLRNKPTISTANNATLTIQQNGTTVKTFTANASSDVTCNITVPTKISDLTNDSGFITGVTWNDVSNKPTLAAVSTSGSYNDLTDKPTIPDVSSYYTKAEVDALINNAGISPSANTLFIGEPYSLVNSAETNLGNYEEVSDD